MIARVILAAASGLILILAHAPFGLGFLAWAGFVPLFLSIRGAGWRRACILGLVSGLVFFAGTVYWVVNSMYYYGSIDLWLSVPIMLLLALYLAVYTGLFGLVFSLAERELSGLALLWVAPALWTSFEYLRATLFTGFPWALSGYTQVPYLTVIQLADMTGVFGIGFIVVLANTAVFLWCRFLIYKEGKPPLGKGGPVKETVMAAVVIFLVFLYGTVKISQTDRATVSWKAVRAAAIQGNIDQSIKWDESALNATVNIYRDLSLKARDSGAGFIVWPETAMPFYVMGDDAKTAAIKAVAKESASFILTGIPSYNYDIDGSGYRYFNSAYLFSPEGAFIGKYDKLHLVPYGEYVPFKKYMPFIKKLTHGAGDFTEGMGPVPIGAGDLMPGALICYESIFPDIARKEILNNATVLVNITNDAWFGRTSAPCQHFGMGVLRAVENRVYLVRAANTGISAFVDPVGRVMKKSALFERGLITEEIRLKTGGKTFYSRHGDVFAFCSLAVSGIFLIFISIRKFS